MSNTNQQFLVRQILAPKFVLFIVCYFDLSKFEKTYRSVGEVLTLYRIGRTTENTDCLGNSWSKSFTGLRSYAQSSSIDGVARPLFEIKVNDSEILCEINSQEDEVILQRGFTSNERRLLGNDERQQVFT